VLFEQMHFPMNHLQKGSFVGFELSRW